MELTILQATSENSGARIDSFLAAQLDGVSRSAAARLIEQGCVLCDGKLPGKSYRMTGSETVSVTLPEAAESEVTAQDIALDVVYEDGDIIVVRQQDDAVNGEVVVALIEDEATVKRFFKENGTYRLQPENPTMMPIIVKSVRILGKVVASLRYYR